MKITQLALYKKMFGGSGGGGGGTTEKKWLFKDVSCRYGNLPSDLPAPVNGKTYIWVSNGKGVAIAECTNDTLNFSYFNGSITTTLKYENGAWNCPNSGHIIGGPLIGVHEYE